MNEKKVEEQRESHVVKLPWTVIEKIVVDAQAAPITEDCDQDCNVRNALCRLGFKWSIIYSGADGRLSTAGFVEYDDCSEMVAKMYGTETTLQYVLRDGVPRKNVKVQVKARL